MLYAPAHAREISGATGAASGAKAAPNAPETQFEETAILVGLLIA